MSNTFQFNPSGIGRPCEVGGSLGRNTLINRPSSTSFSASFAAPSLGTRSFESSSEHAFITANIFAPYPSFKNGSGTSPTYNSTVPQGHRILSTEVESGSYSYQFDYGPWPVPSSSLTVNCEVFRNASTGMNCDEIYFKTSIKFSGTPISSQLKWLRLHVNSFGTASGDNYGLYLQGGTGPATHVAWAFGRHTTLDQNFLQCVGASINAWPTGLTSTYGYTKYGENWYNDGLWHRIMYHYQQNPPGGLAPRVRFWVDGVPVIQTPNAMRNCLNSQNMTDSASVTWVAPDPNDADYGPNAPSWLAITDQRYTPAKLFIMSLNDTMNDGQSGSGSIYYDNMSWSTGAMEP